MIAHGRGGLASVALPQACRASRQPISVAGVKGAAKVATASPVKPINKLVILSSTA
jgi:hypothetical protein